jgi:hypothetical protein
MAISIWWRHDGECDEITCPSPAHHVSTACLLSTSVYMYASLISPQYSRGDAVTSWCARQLEVDEFLNICVLIIGNYTSVIIHTYHVHQACAHAHTHTHALKHARAHIHTHALVLAVSYITELIVYMSRTGRWPVWEHKLPGGLLANFDITALWRHGVSDWFSIDTSIRLMRR